MAIDVVTKIAGKGLALTISSKKKGRPRCIHLPQSDAHFVISQTVANAMISDFLC